MTVYDKWVVTFSTLDEDYVTSFTTKKAAMEYAKIESERMLDAECILVSKLEKQFNGKKKPYCEDIK